jgi:hypothetical protein
MDRVAVLVDAGYLFAQGSALVSTSSKKKRSDIEFDAQRAVQELRQFALKITGGLPLLRRARASYRIAIPTARSIDPITRCLISHELRC